MNERWWQVRTQAEALVLNLRVRDMGYGVMVDAQYLAVCQACKTADPNRDLAEVWDAAETDANVVWVRWLIHADTAHPGLLDEYGLSVGPATPIYDWTRAILKPPIRDLSVAGD